MRIKATVLATLLVLMSLAFGLPAAAEEGGMQRMILAAGCYTLPAQASCDAAAFCLDQSLQPPPSGALLAEAPQAYGNAVVRVNGGAPLTLRAALAQRIVQVEGRGEHLSLRLRNLTHDQVGICMNVPTVVMGNGTTYTGDLAGTYDRITRILEASDTAKARDDAAEMEKREALQQKLWNAVNAADAGANDALSREILNGTLYAPPPMKPTAPRTAQPRDRACSGQGQTAVLCTDQ